MKKLVVALAGLAAVAAVRRRKSAAADQTWAAATRENATTR